MTILWNIRNCKILIPTKWWLFKREKRTIECVKWLADKIFEDIQLNIFKMFLFIVSEILLWSLGFWVLVLCRDELTDESTRVWTWNVPQSLTNYNSGTSWCSSFIRISVVPEVVHPSLVWKWGPIPSLFENSFGRISPHTNPEVRGQF